MRLSIDPHETISGPPDGLLVLTRGSTVKNRAAFGSGDAAGWHRKLTQLRGGQLREVQINARSLNSTGSESAGRTLGKMVIGAVVRDQFTTKNQAPLPVNHPGQLYFYVQHELQARVPGAFQPDTLVRLAQQACAEIPSPWGFVEPSRPLSPSMGEYRLTPASETAWAQAAGWAGS